MNDPSIRGESAASCESFGEETPLVREFADADGSLWSVYEKPFSDYDRRNGVSLIFASEGAVRRVRDYPANWHELSGEELLALSWKA